MMVIFKVSTAIPLFTSLLSSSMLRGITTLFIDVYNIDSLSNGSGWLLDNFDFLWDSYCCIVLASSQWRQNFGSPVRLLISDSLSGQLLRWILYVVINKLMIVQKRPQSVVEYQNSKRYGRSKLGFHLVIEPVFSSDMIRY